MLLQQQSWVTLWHNCSTSENQELVELAETNLTKSENSYTLLHYNGISRSLALQNFLFPNSSDIMTYLKTSYKDKMKTKAHSEGKS